MAKKVTVDWTDSTGNTVAPTHHIVERKTGSGGTYAQLGSNITNGVETYSDESALTDSQEYFYRVGAVFASGNTIYLTGVAITISESSIILFEDDFTGTTIDPLKWTKASENAAYMEAQQDGEIEFNNIDTPLGGTTGKTNLTSIPVFDISTTKVFKFDLLSNTQDTSGCYFGLFKSKPDDVSIDDSFTILGAGATDMRARVNDAGVNDDTDFPLVITSYKSIKIVVDSSNVSFYYWNVSIWTLVITKTHSLSGSFYAALSPRPNGNDIGDLWKVDDVFVTSADWDENTLNPV